jgi:hypothetical protein
LAMCTGPVRRRNSCPQVLWISRWRNPQSRLCHERIQRRMDDARFLSICVSYWNSYIFSSSLPVLYCQSPSRDFRVQPVNEQPRNQGLMTFARKINVFSWNRARETALRCPRDLQFGGSWIGHGVRRPDEPGGLSAKGIAPGFDRVRTGGCIRNSPGWRPGIPPIATAAPPRDVEVHGGSRSSLARSFATGSLTG